MSTFRIWLSVFATMVVLVLPSSALAAVERFGVVIGNNAGGADDQELRYAEDDATKMYDTLKALGGFDPLNLVLLKGENADSVRKTLIAMNDRARASSRTGQTVLLVYYSGHADAANLHLGRSTFGLEELEQLVRGSSAELRLLILDSCKSGALTRVKGGTAAPPVEIRTEGALQGEGILFWTASSASEDAQESDLFKGSFFSHYLNSALVGAGDSDGDGRVTLEEAYRYASENTIRTTSTSSGGTQHPTFRYDLRGQGKVALTTLWDSSKNRGSIVVPSGKPFLVFVGNSDGAVVGEIGAQDRARRVSVKAGTYFVRGRAPDSLVEGTFNVAAGQTREVKETELSRTAYARLVRKGSGEHKATRSVQLGPRLHSPLPNSDGLCFGGFLGAGIDWESASLAVQGGYCRARYLGHELDGAVDEVTLNLRLTKSIDLGRVSPFAAIEGGAVYFQQTFEGREKTAPDVNSLGGNAALVGGIALDLGRGFDLSLEAAAAVYIFSIEGRTSDASVRAAFAFRPAVGLSKTW